MEMMKEKISVGLNIVLLSIAGLCLWSPVFAQENISIEDRIIGSTFKVLAKGYVAITDINKLKENNIRRLNKMDEEKFQRHYVKTYPVIRDLPLSFKARYKISEHMTKQEVIQDIEELDKEKIYGIIDSLPDAFIANNFKQYLNKQRQKIQNSNIVGQINYCWDKIIKKAK